MSLKSGIDKVSDYDLLFFEEENSYLYKFPNESTYLIKPFGKHYALFLLLNGVYLLKTGSFSRVEKCMFIRASNDKDNPANPDKENIHKILNNGKGSYLPASKSTKTLLKVERFSVLS